MEPHEIVASPAAVLALAEQVCPSLNGPASFRLAAFLEAIDCGQGLDQVAEADEIIQSLRTLHPSRIEHWANSLEQLDACLVTVLDDDYPTNLRMIQDHPPFIFVQGTLNLDDDRAIAVVGTRKPSSDGIAFAREVAQALAMSGVTVVSGLAAGIDTVAHGSALEAGGRTLAVYGTGISRVYPAANRALSERIRSAGAVISQFWPDMAGTRWSFPVRNIITSGLSLGTVVVEAGPTSGARQQAQNALRHGKRLFLYEQLVEQQPWAKELIGTDGVHAINDVSDIVAVIEIDLDLTADIFV